MSTNSDLKSQLRREVENVHAFIKDWFNGTIPRENRTFEKRLSTRFAPDMRNIQPSGQVLTRDQLLQPIYMGYGSNDRFDIAIAQFRIIHVSDDNHLALASYIEHQTGAINTSPPDNARISTVLFQIPDPARITSQPPQWLHIHETAV